MRAVDGVTAAIPAVVPLVGQPGPFRPHATTAPVATSNQALPVTRLAARSDRSAVYGLAAVDGRGRLANGAVLAALGWRSSVRLDIRESRGLILITATTNGRHRLTLRGHLALPRSVRRWCGLATGARVLLVAELEEGLLVAYPPAALDAMVAGFRAFRLGGEN